MQLPAADFIARAEDAAGADLPHVNKEFDEFLKCGILAHGFLRLQRSLGIADRVTPLNRPGYELTPRSWTVGR